MQINYDAIKTIKKQVQHALDNYPATRNSDALLVETVCRLFTDRAGERYDQLKIAETVRRSRQYYQNKGYFLPTDPAIIKRRNQNKSEYRVAMGYAAEDGTYTPPSRKEKTVDKF